MIMIFKYVKYCFTEEGNHLLCKAGRTTKGSDCGEEAGRMRLLTDKTVDLGEITWDMVFFRTTWKTSARNGTSTVVLL